MLQANAVLFNNRYTLYRAIERRPDYELWEGRDIFEGPILIKAWPFGNDKPTDAERALWNAELRHLFRLASLPEADQHLVVLRDAGIDWLNHCFVMAMLAPGMSLLDAVLVERSRFDWLKNLNTHRVRADLWRGIHRLAMGIAQLHQQQMFHRAVSPRSILVDPDRGPSTLRLGGFEWTVRLGDEPPTDNPPLPWPAETYSFESDWFLFGVLIARLIGGIDEDSDLGTALSVIRQREHLIGDERDLLEALLADDRGARLTQGYEIARRIDRIVTTLDQPRRTRPDDYLGLVALLGPQRPLTLSIIGLDETISALDIERQRRFIEEDLQKPRIVRREGASRETYTLVGNRLRYVVTEHVPNNTPARGTWDLAYCGSPTELRYSAGDDDQVELRRIPIRVFTVRALAVDESVVRRSSISWRPYLPRTASSGTEQDSLQRIHDFFRVTNQIEILMRDAELFAYVILDSAIVDGAEVVHVQEVSRARPVPEFARLVEGLPEFLKREAENRDGDLVYIGEEDALELGREVPLTEFWNVTDVNSETGIITLRRPRQPGQVAPSNRGWLRAFGLFGQMSLIRRRKRAIDRLGGHAYLLRAIQTPDFAFLDTGAKLPREIDSRKIDEAKRAAMQSIWRTRPIFALQGPPGTGKTTLVANLLGQVFADDPVAQVLVTAQAHAAVDVLREKVAAEVAGMTNEPLAVRLPRTKGDDTQDPDYVEQVAHRVLRQSISDLGKQEVRRPLQSRWLEAAQEAIQALGRRDTTGHAKDLCELIKRAAGITYCTTTAGNLATLADSTQTFDWSIVEEAGKAHGFDLVLPLQTGHRWLLIGDQRQLSPYRYEDFRNALLKLDATFEALENLPNRGGGQVDVDLVLGWKKYDANERASRRELWLNWLRFFETLHSTCERVKLPFDDIEPTSEGGPVLAHMLWQQHRMHPTIAGLVSKAYYRGEIRSETVDTSNAPLPRVTHSFDRPSQLVGRAILWLDIPWNGVSNADQNVSDAEADAIVALLNTLQSSSQDPMTVAILSPYRRQVRLLNDRLASALPEWARRWNNGPGEGKRPAATVDSFQGNQADVVIVSLVRNNLQPSGRGLGFLREPRRMNVLLSRAERLLVLVGSREFFANQLVGVPPDDTQPLGHWRLAMDYIDAGIASGTIALMDVSSLEAAR